jgi:hypothetical protein
MNTDNARLEPLNADGVFIGSVNDVNGARAVEVPLGPKQAQHFDIKCS